MLATAYRNVTLQPDGALAGEQSYSLGDGEIRRTNLCAGLDL